MEYSIDYLSFTIPFDTIAQENHSLMGQLAEQTVSDFLGVYTHAITDNQTFTIGRGRAPYAASWGRADNGVRIFASPTISHVLVEISGIGCKTLRAHDQLEEVLALVCNRVSRIDLAVDIVTDAKPYQFASQRLVERFKTITDWRSETGDTYYVGSMRSDRFARIYRYAPPHPRSKTLRIEHVFRRSAAKSLASSILANGYASTVRSAGDIYGWSAPQWTPQDVEPIVLRSGQERKGTKNTIFWFYGAVTSAAVKACRRGELDLEDWIAHVRVATLSYA